MTDKKTAEKILVVEDEKKINAMISDYLTALDYEVSSAFDGISALRIYRDFSPDLIVLDLMLPGIDGLDITRKIREEAGTPIIMLTARAEESDKLIGLELGADDYLTKPFSMKELAARIRAVLRRTRGSAVTSGNAPVSHIGILLDPEKRLVIRDGRQIPLTSVQFDILSLMIRYPGRVFTRMDILNAIQEIGFEGYERTIDVHIKNIRKALEPEPSSPVYILTVWGVGYKIAEELPERS